MQHGHLELAKEFVFLCVFIYNGFLYLLAQLELVFLQKYQNVFSINFILNRLCMKQQYNINYGTNVDAFPTP